MQLAGRTTRKQQQECFFLPFFRPMQLGGRTRRKTTAGGAHLLEAGGLTRFTHGDRINLRPKCTKFLLITGLQAVSAGLKPPCAEKNALKKCCCPSFNFRLWPSCPADSELQHLIPSGASQAQVTRPVTSISWSRGVTVSTLDSESSDRSSNPRGTSCPPRLLSFPTACFFFMSCPPLSSPMPFCRLAASSMLIASVQPVSHRVIFRTP